MYKYIKHKRTIILLLMRLGCEMDDSGLGKFVFIDQSRAIVTHCQYLSSAALLD